MQLQPFSTADLLKTTEVKAQTQTSFTTVLTNLGEKVRCGLSPRNITFWGVPLKPQSKTFIAYTVAHGESNKIQTDWSEGYRGSRENTFQHVQPH